MAKGFATKPQGVQGLVRRFAGIEASIRQLSSRITGLHIPPDISDTGWVNVPVGASWTTPATGSDHAMMRNVGGCLYFRGTITTISGNFPTSQTVTLISAGGLAGKYRVSNKYNRLLAATTAAQAQRGILDTDGSMSLTTSATTGTWVDISAFTGARTD